MHVIITAIMSKVKFSYLTGAITRYSGAPPENAIGIMSPLFGEEEDGTSEVEMGTFSKFPSWYLSLASGRKRMSSLERVNPTFQSWTKALPYGKGRESLWVSYFVELHRLIPD